MWRPRRQSPARSCPWRSSPRIRDTDTDIDMRTLKALVVAGALLTGGFGAFAAPQQPSGGGDAASSAPAAPEIAPTVDIVSPDAETYLSGPTLLKATAEPASAVASVTISVDGRTICTVEQPPYQCEWDAGAKVTAHQIRVIAALVNGERRVRTLRT